MQLNVNLSVPSLHSQPGYKFFWDYLLEARSRKDVGSSQSHSEFIMFCLTHYQLSTAQLFQDLYVAFKLGSKLDGYFVEFGATNGFTLSNTYLLESKLRWKGIVAEPFPFWHESLAKNRNCIIDKRCVWTKTGETVRFLGTPSDPEFATIETFKDSDHYKELRAKNPEVHMVETISLNDLLTSNQAPKIVDYLSVDTEGSEFEILNAFDFVAHRPRIITVEHNFVEAHKKQVHALLTSHGYVREFEDLSRWDDWYYHPELLQAP